MALGAESGVQCDRGDRAPRSDQALAYAPSPTASLGWAADFTIPPAAGLASDPGNEEGVLLLRFRIGAMEGPVTTLRVAYVEDNTLRIAETTFRVRGVPCHGDVNDDGSINGLDFGAWLNNFNNRCD